MKRHPKHRCTETCSLAPSAPFHPRVAFSSWAWGLGDPGQLQSAVGGEQVGASRFGSFWYTMLFICQPSVRGALIICVIRCFLFSSIRGWRITGKICIVTKIYSAVKAYS